MYHAILDMQLCTHIVTHSAWRLEEASEGTAHTANSAQAPCPARRIQTGREQPRHRPGVEENQEVSKSARYHRPNLRLRQVLKLPLPKEYLRPVLRVNRVQQQQRKPQRLRNQVTTSSRIEHGSRLSIRLTILGPDLQVKVQFGQRREPVRWAASSPNRVRLLKTHQRRESHR